MPELQVTRRAGLELAAFFVLVTAVGWRSGPGPAVLGGVLATLVVLVSVAGHELAHAAVARACGVRVLGFAYRGLVTAATRREVSRNRRVETAIGLAGPAVTAVFLLVGVVVLVAGGPPALGIGLVVVNTVGLLGSLLPDPRTDLGQVLARRRRPV